MTKAETIAALGNQMSSFYSLEQVIDIVSNIDEKGEISKEVLERIVDGIMESLERDVDRFVSKEDAEFELMYDRRIELTDIPVDFDFIREAIENNLDELEKVEDLVELERLED
jgi:polyhydroxyalkanoate synthesis regulator phasin